MILGTLMRFLGVSVVAVVFISAVILAMSFGHVPGILTLVGLFPLAMASILLIFLVDP